MSQTLYWRKAMTETEPLGHSALLKDLLWGYLQWGPDVIDKTSPGYINAGSRTEAFVSGYHVACPSDETAKFLEHLGRFEELEVWVAE